MQKRPSREVRLGLVQMSCTDDPEANVKKALDAIAGAAARGADIVCLQELFRTRYFCQVQDPALFDLAEPVPGPTTEALAGAARRHGVVVVGSVFERRAAGLYHNTAVVIERDGALAGLYRKMHIPDDPLYFEKYYFAPGDTGFLSFATSAARVGTLVCWDQWYPEAARLTALKGAEVLVYPTAIGWHPREKAEQGEAQHQAWETIQRAHAIANGVFVAAVNRVGVEGGLEFWGGSFVADPFGRVLAKASCSGEETLVVALDLARIEDVRRNWPFLRDRRTDSFGGITARFLEP
ncbi:MAG: carbon-nitrogen hydrolase [Planctomycetes bacterium]|nr:carbon-nitrogen hydrolase [Planctomycetota bacterium]